MSGELVETVDVVETGGVVGVGDVLPADDVVPAGDGLPKSPAVTTTDSPIASAAAASQANRGRPQATAA